MKSTFFLTILIAFAMNVYAQQKNYDIVTYTPPSDWTEKQVEGNISYSRIDGGSWAQIAIYQHRTSQGDINTDFDKDWNELVAANKTISSPEKTTPQTAEGWTVMSGSGVWQYNGANVASMLTVYNNNNVCIAILCNATAQPYLKDYLSLIGSLELNADNISAAFGATNNADATKGTPSSVLGLWCDNILETTGTYVNGFPQYTAGYMRKEYAFYPDGTYLFRNKNWQTTMKEILFIYETGTYSVNGNQLTINPKHGKGGWWSKAASGRTTEWGRFVKGSEYKLEKTTYAFEIKYYSGTNIYSLILKPGNATQRDGATEVSYRNYEDRKSIIDNPPGFKTGFENKSLTVSSSLSQTNNTTAAIANNSPLVGKIWEGSSPERAGAGNMQYNTGGFFTNQYTFNSDGTYRFVNVNASAFTNSKSLNYEMGTWSVSSDQLTIIPSKGQNEEWTIIGKTSNGNSDVINRKIMETWNKKTKTSNRKLEKYSYTFSIGKNGDRNALILQRSGHTEREGEGKISYYNETTPGNAVMLPAGFR